MFFLLFLLIIGISLQLSLFYQSAFSLFFIKFILMDRGRKIQQLKKNMAVCYAFTFKSVVSLNAMKFCICVRVYSSFWFLSLRTIYEHCATTTIQQKKNKLYTNIDLKYVYVNTFMMMDIDDDDVLKFTYL